jgi:hypothetical protein
MKLDKLINNIYIYIYILFDYIIFNKIFYVKIIKICVRREKIRLLVLLGYEIDFIV